MITIDSLIGQMKNLFAIKNQFALIRRSIINFIVTSFSTFTKITLKRVTSGKSFPVILFTPQRREWQWEKATQF